MSVLNFITYLIVFIYGLIFGSFFNVCITRIPKGLSILYPPSRCPNCKTKIRWFQNIPVLSYILLGGKCKNCKRSISLVYPLIELITGILAVYIVYHFSSINDGIIKTVIYLFFASNLIILSVIDIKYFIIPDRFTIGGVLTGIFFSSLYPSMHSYISYFDGFIYSFVSSIICFSVLQAVRISGSLIFKREAMGFGDVKLCAAFGAFLGWKLGLLSIFFGSIIGSIIGIFGVLFQYYKMRMEIPFGPFLAIGAFISMLYGNDFLKWYICFMSF